MVCTAETPFDSYFGDFTKNREHVKLWTGAVDWITKEINGEPQLPSVNYSNAFAVTGASFIATPENYNVNGIPSNTPVTWTVTPASGIVSLTTSGNTATLSRIADGSVKLTATFSNSGCQVSVLKTIDSGLPRWEAQILGETTNIERQLFGIYVSPEYPLANNYVWDLGTANAQIYSDEGSSIAGVYYEDGDFDVVVVAETDYGDVAVHGSITVLSHWGLFRLAIYPNPTSDEATVEYVVNDEAKNKTTESQFLRKKFNVKLLNDKGEVLAEKSNSNLEKKLIIDTKNIKDGIYYLHVTEGKTTFKKQIVIKH